MTMLKRQVQMAGDDEFEHIVKNLQRVFKLNSQYENHPYAQEFTKECNIMFVYGTYVLEGEADTKFSLSEAWKLFQEDPLPNNARNFCRQIINCMKAQNYLSDFPLNIETIKQTHKIMIDSEKGVLVEEYRTTSLFAGYHYFASPGYIERYMEGAIFRFHETKKDDPIMAATNFWRNYQYTSI